MTILRVTLIKHIKNNDLSTVKCIINQCELYKLVHIMKQMDPETLIKIYGLLEEDRAEFIYSRLSVDLQQILLR